MAGGVDMALRRQFIQDVQSGATPITELCVAYGISRRPATSGSCVTRPAALSRGGTTESVTMSLDCFVTYVLDRSGQIAVGSVIPRVEEIPRP